MLAGVSHIDIDRNSKRGKQESHAHFFFSLKGEETLIFNLIVINLKRQHINKCKIDMPMVNKGSIDFNYLISICFVLFLI